MTSNSWPSARRRSVTAVSVRTTPLTCGAQASVMIAIFMLGCMLSSAVAPTGSGRHRFEILPHARLGLGRLALLHDLGPVQHFHPSVEMLDQSGAAFDPVAVVIIFDP